jgi:hypothetical protein
MERVGCHRATDGERLIPSVKPFHGAADLQVDDTVQDEPYCALGSVLGKKYYCAVKESVGKEGFRYKYSSFARYLVLGVDAEYVRIVPHLSAIKQIKIIILRSKIKKNQKNRMEKSYFRFP